MWGIKGTWGAPWCGRCDGPARVGCAVFPAEHVVHAQRALCPRCVAIAVVRPRPRAVALRLILMIICPPGPTLPRLRVEQGAAAQVVGLELGAVCRWLRLAPSFAHMRQAACKCTQTWRLP